MNTTTDMTTNTDGAMPELPEPYARHAIWNPKPGGGWDQYHDAGDPMPDKWDDGAPDLVVDLYTADNLTRILREVAAGLARQQVPAAADANARADMAKELANMHHDLLVVMQAAWIEWQRGAGANSAMQWIHNTLMGPGLIPDDDEPYASEPQAYFDKNKAEPFPDCFCGRPSNQLWMGKGFCSQAHYAEARALTQPKE